jgi:type II secretory pathway pseudopilin PulG
LFDLTVGFSPYRLAQSVVEGCAVKTLTVALLILGIFASTALAQSGEQVMKDRRQVFRGWLGTVRAAEDKYKSKHGRYGDLTALREAHMLDLVFESDEPTETGPVTNLVPKSTHFEVTVSGEGEHYKVSIYESWGEWSVGVFVDGKSSGWCVGHTTEVPLEDGPDGPLLSLAG